GGRPPQDRGAAGGDAAAGVRARTGRPAAVRQLRGGDDVLAAGGLRLGTVERLVVDEGAHTVTDLVVRGRVIPLRELRDAGPDGLATDLTDADLERFPTHDKAALEAPGDHWEPPEGYQLHNFLAVAGALLGSA